jgi:hypothetical protein
LPHDELVLVDRPHVIALGLDHLLTEIPPTKPGVSRHDFALPGQTPKNARAA